jgi:hypothetical protein
VKTIKKLIVKILNIPNIILLVFIWFFALLIVASFLIDKFFFSGHIYNWAVNLLLLNAHYSYIFAALEDNLLPLKIFFYIFIGAVAGRMIITKIIKKFVAAGFIRSISLEIINFVFYCAILSQTITVLVSAVMLGYVINTYNEINPGKEIDFTHTTFENIGTYILDKQSSSTLILKQITQEIQNGRININELNDIEYHNFALNICALFENKGNVDTEEEHYLRNHFSRAPETLSEMIATIKNNNMVFKWKLVSPDYAVLHMYGFDGEYNLKFISEDGHLEAVYNKEGRLLTEENDPVNMGTLNYADQVSNKEKRAVLDVLPYFLWTNTKETYINMNENTGEYEEPSDFNANQEAVERFINIYRTIYGKEYINK